MTAPTSSPLHRLHAALEEALPGRSWAVTLRQTPDGTTAVVQADRAPARSCDALVRMLYDIDEGISLGPRQRSLVIDGTALGDVLVMLRQAVR